MNITNVSKLVYYAFEKYECLVFKRIICISSILALNSASNVFDWLVNLFFTGKYPNEDTCSKLLRINFKRIEAKTIKREK